MSVFSSCIITENENGFDRRSTYDGRRDVVSLAPIWNDCHRGLRAERTPNQRSTPVGVSDESAVSSCGAKMRSPTTGTAHVPCDENTPRWVTKRT